MAAAAHLPVLCTLFLAVIMLAAGIHEDDCLEYFAANSEYAELSKVPTYSRMIGYKRRSIAPGRNLHLDAAQHVFAQHLSLPEVVLERSVSNLGDSVRLRNFFHKLRAGQPVSVVAMGGSITCGGNTRSEDEQWSYGVFHWINSTFPHTNHTYLNSCKPATPSMVVGACLRDYIPDQVDLVLFEYTVNDDDWTTSGGLSGLPVMENEYRRGFERYVRKLLKLPQWPALLYLHVWQSAYMGPKFWTGGEMQIESILQYYSVPTVSARNALYELAARNATGFSEEEVHCGVHPNPLGHRYYADLMIATLQDHAYAAYAQAGEQDELPPMFTDLRNLPEPMLEENWEMESACLSGEPLRDAVVPEQSQGWEWVNEGKYGLHPKWGFRTMDPGTSITLQVDSMSGRLGDPKGEILMGLGYLGSYQHMGSFSVECQAGCTCEGISNHSASHKSPSSYQKMVYFAATQAKKCQLRISSLQYTESGEHKVKFDTLMVATGISSKWVGQMNSMFDA